MVIRRLLEAMAPRSPIPGGQKASITYYSSDEQEAQERLRPRTGQVDVLPNTSTVAFDLLAESMDYDHPDRPEDRPF